MAFHPIVLDVKAAAKAARLWRRRHPAVANAWASQAPAVIYVSTAGVARFAL